MMNLSLLEKHLSPLRNIFIHWRNFGTVSISSKDMSFSIEKCLSPEKKCFCLYQFLHRKNIFSIQIHLLSFFTGKICFSNGEIYSPLCYIIFLQWISIFLHYKKKTFSPCEKTPSPVRENGNFPLSGYQLIFGSLGYLMRIPENITNISLPLILLY